MKKLMVVALSVFVAFIAITPNLAVAKTRSKSEFWFPSPVLWPRADSK